MKRRYRVFITLVAVALALAAIVAAFYGIEDWRGARQWEGVQRELATRGESLDSADFIPPPIPDERNVAMIPLFAHALDYSVDPKTHFLTFGPNRPGDDPLREMPYGKAGGKPSGQIGSWMSGRSLPLDRIREYYAERKDFPQLELAVSTPESVRRALTRYAPEFRELEDTLQTRAEGRFPVEWWHEPPSKLSLPHYFLIEKMTETLRLRAVANLAAGRHMEATRDVTMAFRLRAAIQPEPTLIGHLIIVTCDQSILQPVWEGLATRRWTAEELAEIQADLRRDDLLADYTHVLRGERALLIHRTMENIRRTGEWWEEFAMQDNADDHTFLRILSLAMSLGPRGWIDANEANLCQGYQRLLIVAMDMKARRVHPEQIKAMSDERNTNNRVFSPTRFMTKIVLPVVESVLAKTTRTQTACEQAEIACALERHYLKSGIYPETLDALVPSYLDRVPNDLVDGVPMRYIRTADGRYRLYSVGWNARDEGGSIAWPRVVDDTLKPNDKEGDWVWQYTPAPLPGKH